MRSSASPSILPHLPIRRGSGAALHLQIYAGLRRAILDGLLRPGQRVPSTRALAVELRVSRLPVLMAYEQLMHEGYLAGKTGAGTFVSEALPDERATPTPAPAKRRAAAPSASTVERSLRAAYPLALRPFRMNLPALDQFPHKLWSRIVARNAHRLPAAMMAYGDPAGLPELRVAIAEYLRTARAVRCEAEQVLITSGSQSGLSLAAHVVCAPGDRIAIEDPGYTGARAAFEAAGARLAPVRVDDEGISVDALDRLGRRVRAVYITPSHQYPLGSSMSAARRMALLDWADRRGAWIIEDDYDSEYRYVSRPLGALQGMRDDARVIYVGTFSKVLFPALRVGYVVAPPALWNDFVRVRDATDVFSSSLYQLALAEFLREGHFARHIRRMRVLYHQRRDALLEGLSRHCEAELTPLSADAGLHVATLLKVRVRDTAVVQRMPERGLSALPLSTCHLGTPVKHGLLLGFGGYDERRIALATRLLGDLLRSLG